MYAYCLNSPLLYCDDTGTAARMWQDLGATGGSIGFNTAFTYVIAKQVAEIISDVKENIKENPSEREHFVYVLKDSKHTVQYVGRTKKPDKRKAAHQLNPARNGLKFIVIQDNLTLEEAKALEQAGMIYFHTINTANKMNNQINGIAQIKWDKYKKIATGVLEYSWNQMSNEILYWLNN